LDTADQVVFVLQLILLLGPLAVYFLGLGLVNSQAYPVLVNARADFTLLSIAFFPLILGPVVYLVQHGLFVLALGVVLAVAVLFCALRPSRRFAWVIYNISSQQCRRMVEQACRRVGWSVARSDDEYVIAPPGIRLTVNSLSWLRNSTLRLAWDDPARAGTGEAEFVAALEAELRREAMLPSATGASLVVIGASLLGVPMWYLFHHMNAIVDVVRRILFA